MNRRLLGYLALGYFLVSAGLFIVYYVSGKTYFSRVHKQRVEQEGHFEDQHFLDGLAKDLNAARQLEGAKAAVYREAVEAMARQSLDAAAKTLAALADKTKAERKDNPLFDNGPGASLGRDEAARKALQDMVSAPPPPKAPDTEEALAALFDRISGEPGDLVLLRRNGSSAKPMPLAYMELETRRFNFETEAGPRSWTVKAWGKGFTPSKEDPVLAKVLADVEKRESAHMNRLAVFRFGEKEPVWQGSRNTETAADVKYHEDTAQKQGQRIEDLYTPSNLSDGDDGEQELVIKTRLSDPGLKLTFSLVRHIPQSEWTKFSFYDRNRMVIWIFLIVAFIGFPLAAWLAWRLAAQIRFRMTLDLDGEEEDPLSPQPSRMPEIQEPVPEPGLVVPAVHAMSAPAPTASPMPAPEVRQTGVSARLPAIAGLPLRGQDEARHKEVSEIRMNNIRKSAGTFNRRSDEEDIDYLEGVQSEVLKSLIRKLRKD